MKDELIRTEEENNKNSNGFIYVLKNPSLKGMVKIGATTKSPSKKCEELSSTSTIPTPFNIVYSQPSINPFKAVSLVHAILDEYRVYKNSDFFNVDVEKRLNKDYDASSSKGRYAAAGYGLENRPFLLHKRFDNVEELTSMGIDARFIWDYKEGRCLSRAYIPGFDDVDFDEEIDSCDE